MRFKANKKIKNVFMIDDLYGCGRYEYSFYSDNKVYFDDVYNQLSDEISKTTFAAFINARISGNPIYICDVRDGEQYFIKNIIRLTENEVFVDCGAFDGDTVLSFIKYSKNTYNRIYALEPDDKNFEKLTDCIEKNNIKGVVLLKKGVWNQEDVLKFSADASMVSAINEEGTISIEVDSIDNITSGDKVTFIKMDIEGAELAALQGARKTISKNKPKLAISVYHKPEDLIEIPQYIKSLVPEYNLYLRAHKYISVDVVLYATL